MQLFQSVFVQSPDVKSTPHVQEKWQKHRIVHNFPRFIERRLRIICFLLLFHSGLPTFSGIAGDTPDQSGESWAFARGLGEIIPSGGTCGAQGRNQLLAGSVI